MSIQQIEISTEQIEKRIEEIDDKINEILENFENESLIFHISPERIQNILTYAEKTNRKITKIQKEKFLKYLGDTPETQQLIATLSSGEAMAINQEINHLIYDERKRRTDELEKERTYLENLNDILTDISAEKTPQWLKKRACCVFENYLRNIEKYSPEITNGEALAMYMNKPNSMLYTKINNVVFEKFLYGIKKIDDTYWEDWEDENIENISDIEEIFDDIYNTNARHNRFEKWFEKQPVKQIQQVQVKQPTFLNQPTQFKLAESNTQSDGCVETIKNACKLFLLFVGVVIVLIIIISIFARR